MSTERCQNRPLFCKCYPWICAPYTPKVTLNPGTTSVRGKEYGAVLLTRPWLRSLLWVYPPDCEQVIRIGRVGSEVRLYQLFTLGSLAHKDVLAHPQRYLLSGSGTSKNQKQASRQEKTASVLWSHKI